MPEIFINGKDAVTVFTAERHKLYPAAVGAGIHGPTKGRIVTVNYFFDVLHFDSPGMERILNGFIIVFKNLL